MDVWRGPMQPQAEAEESPSGGSSQPQDNRQHYLCAQVARCSPEQGRGHPPTSAEVTAWLQGDHSRVAPWILKDCSFERLADAPWTGEEPPSHHRPGQQWQ